MTRIMRRFYLLVLAAALVGAAFGSFHQSTVFAQGDWGYMCDSWEQSCDDGSGDWWESDGDGGGGGGTPHGPWVCPDMDRCNSLGCNPRSYLDQTMVCSRWKKDPDQTFPCGPANCVRTH